MAREMARAVWTFWPSTITRCCCQSRPISRAANSPSGMSVVSTSSASRVRSRSLPKCTRSSSSWPAAAYTMHLHLEVPAMRDIQFVSIFAAALCAICAPVSARTMADVLAASKPSAWRSPDPANTLYMELDAGRVIIELAPQFAPRLIGNLKILAREKYFDGLAIMRAQDNFVVQWGDADEENPRATGTAQTKVPAEFERAAQGLAFTALPD